MIDRAPEIRRVLITGAAGSSGRYLADYLLREHPDVEVHGGCRRFRSRQPVEGVTLHEMDLLDFGSITRCLRRSRPDAIFHVAANPDKGFEVPSGILLNNVIGTANLFEAVLQRRFSEHAPSGHVDVHGDVGLEDVFGSMQHGCGPVVVNVSSSEVYGAVEPWDVPIKEDCPMRPVSPYGIGKMAQDHLGRMYHKVHGLRIVTTRAFTYINHLRPDLFMSAFARQIALIEAGKQEVLKHGNLDSVRVMCDARDVMHAYWLAATRCRFGEAYNIGGSDPVSVGDVLYKLWDMSSMLRHSPLDYFKQDPDLMRPADVTLQIPDCGKFKEETGWGPKFDLTDSLRGLLDHWRKEVRK